MFAMHEEFHFAENGREVNAETFMYGSKKSQANDAKRD
jgi:hypothetical protein